MSSPRRKKMKLTKAPLAENGTLKRINDDDGSAPKRVKNETPTNEDLQAKRRKNFIKTCEVVSYEAYFSQNRFLLDYFPDCANHNTCQHQDFKNGAKIKVIPPYVEESLKIEMKSYMWLEALEVCRLSITPQQYPTPNFLKDIVEIILNAHDDEYADYTIDYLMDQCQEIFEMIFSYHPPCLAKTLRKCYNDFLTSPMDAKENTFTNRSQFGYDKGIVKYCLNRLEHEISLESKDGPLIDKYENIPEEMRDSVQGLHWQKEKFVIYELLERSERIDRLIVVLDIVIELLQTDLAIWHSRYTNKLGTHIMRSHKPLMAYLLWSNNVLFTGAVNNNCRQILRLFIYIVHLGYPEEYVKTMTTWLNTMIQTFYICESNSNSDYPNTGKYCKSFANEFYKIISQMPPDTIIKILERIKPEYMQYLLGTLHIKALLSIEENDPIKCFTVFLEQKQWKKFSITDTEIKILKKKKISQKNLKNFTNYLIKKCDNINSNLSHSEEVESLCKFDPKSIEKASTISLNHIVHIFYITVEAYLDAYNVQRFQETLGKLNESLICGSASNEVNIPKSSSYSVTENLIKKYRSIYQALKELVLMLQELKNSGELPPIFKVYDNIDLLCV